MSPNKTFNKKSYEYIPTPGLNLCKILLLSSEKQQREIAKFYVF